MIYRIKTTKAVFLLSLGFSLMTASLQSKEVTLSKAKVYIGYQEEESIQVTVVKMGGQDSKLALLKFKAPENKLDGKSFVYYQNCETTRCDKVFFRRLGSGNTNLISRGRYYELLLPGVKGKFSLRFDKELSETENSQAIFNQHLKSIYRFGEFNESKAKIDKAHAEFNEVCKSNSKINVNADAFQKSSQQSLIGMGTHYLNQLVGFCNEDKLYQDIFTKIKKINLMPSATQKDLSLTKNMELTIYLSDDIYNPSEQGKAAIEKL